MSADLAVYTSDPSALDQLGEQGVTALMERAKSWLGLAIERGVEIDELVAFKGEAAVVRELIVQKELGKDAELSAAELVRRAQRGIGVAIRKGQEAGEIRAQGQSGGPRGEYVRAGQIVRAPLQNGVDRLKSPTDFVPGDELARQIYPVTDGISDEQYESGLAEAKAEGNLSSANVVRKITGKPKPKGRRPDVLRGTRRIDSRRVIAATVESYLNNAIPRDLLAEVNFAELDTNDLREWISSLSESARALRSLRTTLEKELSQRG